MLDFVQFINDNWGAAPAVKLAMLNSFVAQYGYEETVTNDDGNEVPNPVSKGEFANARIVAFICGSVNAFRRSAAEAEAVFEELTLE